MENNLTSFKVSAVAFFTAVGGFLGWQGVMILIWVVAMTLDYLSGTFAAVKNREWSSEKARAGLWHKGGMILVVMVAGAADLVMRIVCDHLPIEMTWPVLILPLVLAWYIITELGSILENALKLGAPIPAWLVKALKVGLRAVDKEGEALENAANVANSQTIENE